MTVTKNIEFIAIIESDLKLLISFRKQLFDNGSILLTAEHDHFLNQLANTLSAFKIFLETNGKSNLQEINSRF